jgi:hypothetical protein
MTWSGQGRYIDGMTDSEPNHQWLTPAEAAQRLCVHPETLRRRSNELPDGCVETTEGGHRRYRADLLRPLPHAVQPAPQPAPQPHVCERCAEPDPLAEPQVWDVAWAADIGGVCTVVCPQSMTELEARAAFHSLSGENVYQLTGELIGARTVAPSPNLYTTAHELRERKAARERRLREADLADETRHLRLNAEPDPDGMVETGPAERVWRIVWRARVRGVEQYEAHCEDDCMRQFAAAERQVLASGKTPEGSVEGLVIEMIHQTEGTLGLRPIRRDLDRTLGFARDLQTVAGDVPRDQAVSAGSYESRCQLLWDASSGGSHPASASRMRKWLGSWDSVSSLMGRPAVEKSERVSAAS